MILFGLIFLSAYIENSLGETEYVQRVASISADDVANYEAVCRYLSQIEKRVHYFFEHDQRIGSAGSRQAL